MTDSSTSPRDSSRGDEAASSPRRQKIRKKRCVPSSTAPVKRRTSAAPPNTSGKSQRRSAPGLVTRLRSKLDHSTRAARRDRKRRIKRFVLILSAIMLGGFIAYSPLLGTGPIWPDQTLIRDHPLVENESGFYNAWVPDSQRTYQPLAWNALWLQRRTWGSEEYGFQFISILLHILNALVLWRLLKRLRFEHAWFAAFLTVIHPGAVFAAGWISMQPILLATAFLLWSVLCMINYERTQHVDWQLAAMITMVCALLSQPAIGMAVPFCGLAVLWWLRGKRNGIDIRHLKRCLPMFIATGVALAGHILLFRSGASDLTLSALERILAAPVISLRIIGHAIVPGMQQLAYPVQYLSRLNRWTLGPVTLMAFFVIGHVLWRYRTRSIARLAIMGGWIMLVLALAQSILPGRDLASTARLVPDAWKYPLVLAFTPMLAAALLLLVKPRNDTNHYPGLMMILIIVLFLGGISWNDSWRLNDSIGLWKEVVEQGDPAGLAHRQLAWQHVRDQNHLAARDLFITAVERNPRSVDAHFGLGLAQWKLGALADAEKSLKTALEMNPNHADSQVTLTAVQDLLLEREFSVPEFIHRNRDYVIETMNAADLLEFDRDRIRQDTLHENGKLDLIMQTIDREQWQTAAIYAQELIRQHPDKGLPHYLLGFVLHNLGKVGEATREFETALEMDSGFVGAHFIMGQFMLRHNDLEAAHKHFVKALNLAPNMADAHYGIGIIASRHDDIRECLNHLSTAIRVNSRHADALNALARILAANPEQRYRNGRQAVVLAERAVLVDAKNPLFLDTLAIAYAEVGMFQDALRVAQRGILEADKRGWQEVAQTMKNRTVLFEQEKPYREALPSLQF